MRNFILDLRFPLLVACLGLGINEQVVAQPVQDPPAEEQEESKKKNKAEKADAEAKDETDATPEESPFIAVTGGDVYTVTRGVMPGATVLIKKDRILKVGNDVLIPEGARVLDAEGMRVYPGLVAVNSSGIHRGGSKPLDSFDPFSLTLDLALAGGITCAQAGGSVMKLTRGTLDHSLVSTDVWATLSYSSTSPSSRRRLRGSLDQAREHLREMQRYQAAKKLGEEDLKEPDDKGINKTHLGLLQGSKIARFNANTVKDLHAICDLLETYPMKAVIFGGQEAWSAASRLGRSGAWMVLSPRSKRREDLRLTRPSGWSIENARVLHDAGVNFAIVPSSAWISTGGTAGRDLLTLPLEAAFAIRGGLPQEAALRAITYEAAKILGLEHRVGSIEPGKDADLIITDGDLFDYRTFVQYSLVNGRVAYDKQAAPYFAHIRPREAPTLEEVWEGIRKAAEEQAEENAAKEEGKESDEERPPDAPEKGDDQRL